MTHPRLVEVASEATGTSKDTALEPTSVSAAHIYQ